MITILITGPQKSGKSLIADTLKIVLKKMAVINKHTIRVITSNDESMTRAIESYPHEVAYTCTPDADGSPMNENRERTFRPRGPYREEE